MASQERAVFPLLLLAENVRHYVAAVPHDYGHLGRKTTVSVRRCTEDFDLRPCTVPGHGNRVLPVGADGRGKPPASCRNEDVSPTSEAAAALVTSTWTSTIVGVDSVRADLHDRMAVEALVLSRRLGPTVGAEQEREASTAVGPTTRTTRVRGKETPTPTRRILSQGWRQHLYPGLPGQLWPVRTWCPGIQPCAAGELPEAE